ncbi:hypothetical protein FRC19_008385 [Serendipita sp. 401]|nr:hypothetical protein FRC15_011487 [Serendipita sp. 397]KAG8793958.1 hypothetical protein FRC16_010757 [Serendipita sp. 398]KAG8828269.1 hypothetical protein FRC19_008385 [Serendipita sp. 401]KAG8845612.1 hypothetical protein FRC20_003147 [Serendipita sp. 405]KAG9058763.1 hypothetical protein FS842_003552 [Serendipita sp. 407]
MSILNLPVEITLEILKYLTPKHSPIVGNDVAWKKTETIYNWWRRPRDLSLDPNTLGPAPYGDIEDTPYSSLLSLQQTCRFFNTLCTPLLYSEINAFDKLDYEPIMKYKDHVRTLRLTIGPADIISASKPSSYLDYTGISSILSTCHKTTSLVLYYMPSDIEESDVYQDLANTIKEFVISHNIKSLGVCNVSIVDDFRTWEDTSGQWSLLEHITSEFAMLNDIDVLDIACSAPDAMSYSSLQNLVSLTVREAVDTEFDSPLLQFASATLVKLQLIECRAVYAGHIPDLVRQCPALRSLFVSTCGDGSDVEIPFRPAGWSEENDALWRDHQPLDHFHLEHMLGWEIAAMATIPAREVVLTSLRDGELLNAFERDKEMFPQLELLHIDVDLDMKEAEGRRLSEILGKRRVDWKIDAHWTVNQTYP